MQFGVSESVFHWGKYRPSSIAVYCDGDKYTYRELNNGINNLCKEIRNHKILNKRIGLSISNKYHLLIALIAVLRVRKSNVFLNIKLSKENLSTNIMDSGITDLIYNSNCADICSLFSNPKSNLINIEDILNQNNESSNTGYLDSYSMPDDEWGILFSSGTTGTPKGISRDHYSMVTEHIGWGLELALNRNTKFYIGRPLFYTGGLVLALSTLLVGGSIIINNYINDNDFEEIWNDFLLTIKDIREIEWAFFIPDQLRKFCKIVSSIKDIEKTSKNILVMGAPITGEEKIEAYKLLRTDIVESWGNSESLGTITDPEDIIKRPDSVGRPFLTDEMYIINSKDEIVFEPNTIGRISGSIEAGFKEYTNRPDDTQKVIKNDSIISEDLGYFDKDGYFYIKSRLQDSILVNGRTIFLTEIEDIIRSNFNIYEFCVTYKSIEDNDFIIYLVIGKNELNHTSAEELLVKINLLLDDNRKIKRIFILEHLPKVASGKVDKLSVNKIIQSL